MNLEQRPQHLPNQEVYYPIAKKNVEVPPNNLYSYSNLVVKSKKPLINALSTGYFILLLDPLALVLIFLIQATTFFLYLHVESIGLVENAWLTSTTFTSCTRRFTDGMSKLSI